ncbi:hypothetical protein LOK49_LG14G00085 [Camellia lanceoleosa]|uniref:Uncharacterized protein n=1 Tax=Camellia lanceoleosa TaxID=1840588 RepID=A0ACC0FAM4_9ERIC|nr:hypothetical protein LOK49_LG14G00085 [Camellia lanceoleosa]
MATISSPNPNPVPKSSAYMQDTEEVKKVFNGFDGKISAKYVVDIIKALESDTSEEEVKWVMEEFGTGFISLEEFASFCKDDGDDLEALKDVFEFFDQDNTGLISAGALHLVFHRLGDNFSIQDCGRMINSFDYEGDGFVNFEDFKKMMTTTTTPSV